VNAGEATALALIYREAVLQLGRRRYDAEQCRAWAAGADDTDAFARQLCTGMTLCIEVAGTPVAFGQLNPVDHIALLYSHPAHTGNGYASTILAALEKSAREQGVCRLSVNASLVAQPFFSRHGFLYVKQESVTRDGVTLSRYRMEKTLTATEHP
jgi:putative acetyltransferase